MYRESIYVACFVVLLGLAGNVSGQPGKGHILFEYYWGTDMDIDTLLSLPSFPDNPDDSEWRDVFEGNTNWRDNYGTRVRGYVYPPQTGDYTFWIASDDNGQLWLSSDDDPVNAVMIATVSSQARSQEWDKFPEQKSSPITLQAGQKYYIEALHSQGGGRDNLAVGWAGPGVGADPLVIEGAFLSPWLRQIDLIATNPDPTDGSEHILAPVILKWTPGLTAFFHHVYIGTNPDFGSVEPAIQRRNTYYLPSLAPATTYYWRIDEIELDGTTKHTGEVWSFTTSPLTAHSPNPPDRARFVDPDIVLSWGVGLTAIAHDVYLGTNEAAVANATTASPEFKAYQLATTFDPETLDRDTAYYWRIDEVEVDTTTKRKGDVWRFATIPEISTISDPNLLGWWRLDEGPGGTVAVDWSGHGNDGSLRNGPQWVADGYHGGALHFNGGNDYVAIKNLNYRGGGHKEVSVCAWVRTNSADDQYIISFDGNQYWHLVVNRYAGPGEIAWDVRTDDGALRCSGPRVDDGQWHHVAGVFDSGTSTIYVDGVAGSPTTNGSTFGDEWSDSPRFGFIGANSAASAYDGTRASGSSIMGKLDDVRVYDKALTKAQIEEVMRGDTTLARDPKPADEAVTDLEEVLPLTWSPGDGATQHHVYFGTDEFAVAVAEISDTTGIYRGRQDSNSYVPPEGVEIGRSYYWRVDQVYADGTSTTGRVWGFTVADYLTVDDFESYSDDLTNRIFQTWIDGWGYTQPPPGHSGNGSGSTVGHLQPPFAEQTIVHSGKQSMPFEYLNDGSAGKVLYSEAVRTFDPAQDWTRRGVKALTLWFHGDSDNSAEPLYVGIQDSLGTRKDVPHENVNAVLSDSWQEWSINLNDFAIAGVNLTSVRAMSFGVGNRIAPQAGGTGRMYFDDIRLYQPRFIPHELPPMSGDLVYDGMINYADLKALAAEWLGSGGDLAADLDGDNDVDLEDYAILAGGWLFEQLWPEE